MNPTLQHFQATLVPQPGNLPHKEFESSRLFDTQPAAIAAYERAKERLLSPHLWSGLAGNFGASFLPFDQEGKVLPGKVAEGNYLKISIPLPLDVRYDWVKIEALMQTDTDEEQLIGMRVRPTADLQKEENETAHFFSKTATSTWILHRLHNTVTAYYFGRGEQPNEEGESFWKKLRDTVVALAGVAGFSDLQWTALLEGLLGDGEQKSEA